MNIYTLLYTRQITNKGLLYGTGNCTQYSDNLYCKRILKRMNICIIEALCCTPKTAAAAAAAKSLQSCLTLCSPMDYIQQAPLSLGFSRQEYWSGLPFPLSKNLPDPGIESAFLTSPTLAGRFLTTSVTWEAQPCLSVNWSYHSIDKNSFLQAYVCQDKLLA